MFTWYDVVFLVLVVLGFAFWVYFSSIEIKEKSIADKRERGS